LQRKKSCKVYPENHYLTFFCNESDYIISNCNNLFLLVGRLVIIIVEGYLHERTITNKKGVGGLVFVSWLFVCINHSDKNSKIESSLGRAQ
jgi:hypothetical protein